MARSRIHGRILINLMVSLETIFLRDFYFFKRNYFIFHLKIMNPLKRKIIFMLFSTSYDLF
jgi:hypothetical protein